MNRLQERRMMLGLTQPDVSAKLKQIDPRMDVSMVSRFERGVCLPTLPVLEALEDILQAPRTTLFDEDELGIIPGSESAESAEASTMTIALATAILFGRRNAIARDELAEKLNMSDRTMRKAVENARSEGLIILCECNGRGYYQSNDLTEIRRQYTQDTRRAMAILERSKPMRVLLRAANRNV